jgi:GT2 family glycosyltransferase
VGGTTDNVGDTFTQQAIGLAMSSPFGILSAPYRYSSRAQYVDTVIYGAYRRELFEELGLFDEKGGISEDAEFNWRIRKAGHKIYYTPEIKAYYYPRKSIPRLIKQFLKYGILRVNVIKKHMDAVKIKHLLPSLMLLLMVTLLGLSIWKGVFCYPILALVAAYLFFIFIGSVQICLRKGWRYLAILPLIFMALHFSFAAGFLVGVFKKR